MAFPKSHEIAGLTTQPELNPSVSACFLPQQVLNEALILVRTMSPGDLSALSQMETSQIALTLNKYKDENNRNYASTDPELGRRRPTGRIEQIDNRISATVPGTNWRQGVRVQYLDNMSKLVTGFIGGSLFTGVLAGAPAGAGSVVGRGLAQLGALVASGLGTHYVTTRAASVNQMAAHIKKLAETFNTTYNAFGEFRNDVFKKLMNFKPDLESNNPVSFEQKTTIENGIPANDATQIQQILRQLAYSNQIDRIDIVGQGDNFIGVYFNQTQLNLTRIQYDYLTNLKLP
ncbi:hypothetical protein J2125_004009 [Erwinia toletana]|uniref:Uncharacterized protein n=1 Tax=Winslowiella toletana TaxID=92490 RepID=A0ABS4PDY4_9GAMM|nr:hypothetical protein [Winslowiella toletana]MBP2170817.1 hypothetical protein [Winslowiella toletana]